MLLYKYCAPGGLAILETGSIFLTRPRAFNDPFDLNPYITKFDDAVEMGEHLQHKMRDIVVLSLAENCDSLLMWAHYAAQHAGFLIGFNGSERILDRPTPLFHHFDAVSYCHHRATGQRFTHIPDHEIYFRKSSEWAYEKEWRLIESIIAIDGNVDDPKPNWPFPLVTKTIKKVVVGHRASGLFPKLYELLRQERYENIELQLAIPDLKTFRLNLVDWPRANWHEIPPHPLETVGS